MLTFVLIISFLVAGKLMQLRLDLPGSIPHRLNAFVIYVAFPAVIFLRIPSLTIDTHLLFPIAIPWLGLVLAATLSLGICRYFKWSRQVEVNLLILTALGNTGFLGYPMAKAFFPESSLPYALIYDQTGTFIGLTTYATILVAIYSGGTEQVQFRSVIRKILLFPPFISLILALFIPAGIYPKSLTQMMEWLSMSIIPLTMLSIGMQFKIRIDSEDRAPLSAALIIKMVVLPLFVWGAADLLDIEKPIADVSVFLAAMPSMITGAAILISHNLAPRLTVAILGFGTLLSLITLPLWNFLLKITS